MTCEHKAAYPLARWIDWCPSCGAVSGMHKRGQAFERKRWRLPRAAERWRTGVPRREGEYLVTYQTPEMSRGAVWAAHFDGARWSGQGDDFEGVLAWMPMPKPFKPARGK